MTNSTKKVYLVYGGDNVPYEPTHVIASFLDKAKAEEFVEKLKEEDEKNRELEEQYKAKIKEWSVQRELENDEYWGSRF